MLILYTKTLCPFCKKVLDIAERLGISFNERNISDEKNLQELIEKGGKRMVPFLIDEERGTSLYESDDIVSYLIKEYGGGMDVSAEEQKEKGGVCPI